MNRVADLLPGTLDLLILKALSLAPEHGYGVLLRIEHISQQRFRIEQGALYPALHRLDHQGLLDAEWRTSENNRRAKYYSLTPTGRARLRDETAGWQRLVAAMAAVLAARPEEV
jgi:PadR family transcriptional regulator PadR